MSYRCMVVFTYTYVCCESQQSVLLVHVCPLRKWCLLSSYILFFTIHSLYSGSSEVAYGTYSCAVYIISLWLLFFSVYSNLSVSPPFPVCPSLYLFLGLYLLIVSPNCICFSTYFSLFLPAAVSVGDHGSPFSPVSCY